MLVGELRTGTPSPPTRFWLIVFPVSAALEPAVTRTPSWPNNRPVVIRLLPGEPLAVQLPSVPKFVHSRRPTIELLEISPRFQTPERTKGAASLVAPSISTPMRL